MNEERENLKRIRKLFHAAFAESMKRYGFDCHGGGMYYEKTDFGRKGVMIVDYFRFGALQMSANITVTLLDVERLLFEYRTQVRGDTDLRKPNVQTISQNLGNIKTGIFRSWNNYNDADINETLEEIENLIRDYGIAFLETVDTPEKALHEILETTKRKTKLGHPSFWYEKAFVLMMLEKERALFEENLPIFERYVKNSGAVWSEYLRFKTWIISNPLWGTDSRGQLTRISEAP